MKRLAAALICVLGATLSVEPAFAQEGKKDEKKSEAVAGAAGVTGVTGLWKCVIKVEGQPAREFSLDLSQKGSAVTGTGSNANGSVEISKGSFETGKLKFQIELGAGPIDFEATLSSDKLAGTLTRPDGLKANWEGGRDVGRPGDKAALTSNGILGTWKVTAKRGENTSEYTMELKQEGDKLTGKMTGPAGESIELTKVSFADNLLKFSIPTDNGTYDVEGKLEGEKLSGTAVGPNGNKRTWEGKRI